VGISDFGRIVQGLQTPTAAQADRIAEALGLPSDRLLEAIATHRAPNHQDDADRVAARSGVKSADYGDRHGKP
jgi:hypothetical protein